VRRFPNARANSASRLSWLTKTSGFDLSVIETEEAAAIKAAESLAGGIFLAILKTLSVAELP
jgi:hypothetical protein